MSNLGSEAAPLSNAAIRDYALKIRMACGMSDIPYANIEYLLDFIVPMGLPDFQYEIMESSRMGTNHGLAIPDRQTIIIRDDVFDRACEGRGRDRFTIIHELGHVLIHTSDRMRLRRGSGPVKTYCDPEWQADAFAGEFLAPKSLAPPNATPEKLMQHFGISRDAALTMIRKWQREDQ